MPAAAVAVKEANPPRVLAPAPKSISLPITVRLPVLASATLLPVAPRRLVSWTVGAAMITVPPVLAVKDPADRSRVPEASVSATFGPRKSIAPLLRKVTFWLLTTPTSIAGSMMAPTLGRLVVPALAKVIWLLSRVMLGAVRAVPKATWVSPVAAISKLLPALSVAPDSTVTLLTSDKDAATSCAALGMLTVAAAPFDT